MTITTDRLVAATKAAETSSNHWILVDSKGREIGDSGGIPHYLSREQAQDNISRIATPPGEVLTPQQLDTPCIFIACTCCEVVYDEEESSFCCFDSIEEATKTLVGIGIGWSDEDGELKCEVCTGGLCDIEAGYHG